MKLRTAVRDSSTVASTDMDDFSIFGGTANPVLAEAIARELGVPLGTCSVERFPNGEVSVRLEEPVRGKEVFGMVGRYDTWTDADGNELHTCAIITTEANGLMVPIHHRMPVIIRPEDEALWLDPEITDPGQLQRFLVPYGASEREAHPVSTALNRPANESKEVLEQTEALPTV